ncbi:HTH-type transcriptional regulator TnrA [Peribacillus sp. Bi96]|nr:HTH-type transcriptional regulator TnrA [Peribacillus sp. Bi96]
MIFIVQQKESYIDRKVISIGVVRELTGLSDRQIRYYEERKLVFPERSKGGNRKYSFSDVKALVEIADKIEDGVQTNEIRQEKLKENKKIEQEKMRKKMLQGQLNAHFGMRN